MQLRGGVYIAITVSEREAYANPKGLMDLKHEEVNTKTALPHHYYRHDTKPIAPYQN